MKKPDWKKLAKFARPALIGVLAIGFGIGANVLFVRVPGTLPVEPPEAGVWELDEGAPLADLDATDAIWAEKTPWGAPPQPPGPPPPPPPSPIGVIKDGNRNYRAVFNVEGAGQLALRPGERLPGGGRVLSVAGLKVVWVDGDGQRHERVIFNTYQEEAVAR